MEPIPQSNNESQSQHLNEKKLEVWLGSALLSAECVGVGILALPHDVKNVIGLRYGLFFLILNFPINYIAGNFLSILALDIENKEESHEQEEDEGKVEMMDVVASDDDETDFVEDSFEDENKDTEDETEVLQNLSLSENETHRDVSTTSDLISISEEVFQSNFVTNCVLTIYYLNLFLVLGDYILVMSRSVSAMFLDRICTPVAGVIASTLIFGICQLKTMSNLGRKVSVASLLAMMIVLLQCLFHHRSLDRSTSFQEERQYKVQDPTIWEKFSAFASIGFAVGSQKLFLNVRHELKHREKASKVLAWSLLTYGNIYLMVILLAGTDPPSFLFDAIPEGSGRQIAGFLLWGHVAVSYAINCQALCSSIDRYLVLRYPTSDARSWIGSSDKRWVILTFGVALSSYLVSNAIPFFKDLVALIGALTSVPLTLTLPTLLHRKANKFPILLPGWKIRESFGSYSLFLYSLIFLVVGMIGAISSIDQDWMNQSGAFACH